MKARLTDRWIYIIAVINAVLLICIWGVFPISCWDSTTYINAWDNSLSQGRIDFIRTPVYPIFIGIIKFLFNSHYLLATIIIQHLIFIVSIYYFKEILLWKIKSRQIVNWMTIVYILIPATSTWANCILTESLTMSFIVFLIYCICTFQQKAHIQYVLYITLWLFLLIFIRPACLYLIVALTITWFFFFKHHRKLAIFGLCGIILVGVLEIGYCFKFKNEFGQFTPSSVSTMNQTFIAFNAGLMKSSYTNIPEYKEYIEKNNNKEISMAEPIVLFGLTTVHESILASKKEQPFLWFKQIIAHFRDSTKISIIAADYGSNILREILSINMNILYIFLVIYLLAIIYLTVKRRHIYIFSSIIWITCFGNVLLVIFGAQSEWNRLILPSMPLILIMFGQALNYIKLDINEFTKKTDIE